MYFIHIYTRKTLPPLLRAVGNEKILENRYIKNKITLPQGSMRIKEKQWAFYLIMRCIFIFVKNYFHRLKVLYKTHNLLSEKAHIFASS